MLKGSAPVFAVADIAASLVHYRDVLGFQVSFEWGDPLFYVCLCRDEVALHLVSSRGGRAPGQSVLCVFVTDVDALHAEFAGLGAKVTGPPQTHDYGMRDFDVLDLDGNRLIYGMGVS